MERLDKIISNRTGISRKDAKAAISSGKVTVSGNIIRSSDYKVGENEEIILDGIEAFYIDFVPIKTTV